MVRASSPSRARTLLMFCTKLVAPSVVLLVEDLVADLAARRQAVLPASDMRIVVIWSRGTRMVSPSPRIS